MVSTRPRRAAAQRAQEAMEENEGIEGCSAFPARSPVPLLKDDSDAEQPGAPEDDFTPTADDGDEDFEAPVMIEQHVHVPIEPAISALPLPNEIMLALIDILAEEDIVNLFRVMCTCRAFYHLIEKDEKAFQRRAKQLGAKQKKPRSSWFLTFVDKYLKVCKFCRCQRPKGKWRGRAHPYFLQEPKNVFVCHECQYQHDVDLRYRVDEEWEADYQEKAQALAFPLPSNIGIGSVWLSRDLKKLQEEIDEKRAADLEDVLQGLSEEDGGYFKTLKATFNDKEYLAKSCVETLWRKRFQGGSVVTEKKILDILILARQRDAVVVDVREAIEDSYEGAERKKMLDTVNTGLKLQYDMARPYSDAYYAAYGDGSWHDRLTEGVVTIDEFLTRLKTVSPVNSIEAAESSSDDDED